MPGDSAGATSFASEKPLVSRVYAAPAGKDYYATIGCLLLAVGIGPIQTSPKRKRGNDGSRSRFALTVGFDRATGVSHSFERPEAH